MSNTGTRGGEVVAMVVGNADGAMGTGHSIPPATVTYADLDFNMA